MPSNFWTWPLLSARDLVAATARERCALGSTLRARQPWAWGGARRGSARRASPDGARRMPQYRRGAGIPTQEVGGRALKRSEQRALYESTTRSAEANEEIERLRGQAQQGRLSYGEIARLQSDLVAHIDPDDVEMLAWADVDEFD